METAVVVCARWNCTCRTPPGVLLRGRNKKRAKLCSAVLQAVNSRIGPPGWKLGARVPIYDSTWTLVCLLRDAAIHFGRHTYGTQSFAPNT